MTFTPHNAVAVSFEWDEVSDKHYAILCRDFASDSGYEYINANPGLGDGALIAEFSDGTITSSDWKTFVANYGPTDESEANGCAATNLAPCVVNEIGNPDNWFGVDFDYSGWDSATVYTAQEAGWGRAPTWVEGSGCCTATNPVDRSNLLLDGGCSVNYDPALDRGVRTTVIESECLNPRDEFATTSAEFLWGSDLEKDNRVLFRTTVPADGSTTNTDTGTAVAPPDTTTNTVATASSSSPWAACTPTTDYPQCTAPTRTLVSQRVRKEIRSLTMEEWERVVTAMWTMKTETTESGRAKYGSQFRTYDYFVVKHAVATTDSRGDQAHFGAHFISWHSAFVLEFENTLLAIDPMIGAMPYWDETIASPSVFTEDYFGTDPDTAVSPDVTTGKFANFPVDTNFSFDDYAAYITDDSTVTYRGTGDSLSILRGTANLGTSPVVIRQGSGSGWEARPPSIDDWWACTAEDGFTDWYTCIEQGRTSFHSGPHGSIGGRGADSIRGDFEDPITSPNGPIFMFHHANLDRNRMWWMRRNSGAACSYYGFPVTDAAFVGPRPGVEGAGSFDGAHLNDVAASAWGFTAAELGFEVPSDDGTPLTHADLTCWMDPSTAAYTYDTNADCLLDNSTCNSVQGVIEYVVTVDEQSGCMSFMRPGTFLVVAMSLAIFA